MFKLDLEKTEEPEIKLPTSVPSLRKQESSRKTSTSALLIMTKPLTVWMTTNSGKFFKRWEYQPSTCLLRNLHAGQETTIRTGHGMTGSELGKEYNKAVYCHPAYLTYMQRASCKILGWKNHELESRFLGEMSTTLHMQMISL